MGFGVPIDGWLRNELKEMTGDLLLDKTAVERGFFKKTAVEKLVREHQSGTINHCYRIWNLLWLELWHRIYVDKTLSEPAGAYKPSPGE